MPCGADPGLIGELAHAGVEIVATLHVIRLVVGCPGLLENAASFLGSGGTILYGSDYGVTGIPRGVDVAERRVLAGVGPGRAALSSPRDQGGDCGRGRRPRAARRGKPCRRRRGPRRPYAEPQRPLRPRARHPRRCDPGRRLMPTLDAVETTATSTRRRELTAQRYARLALSSAASLYLIVLTGAAVRLTGSGLACESWPGCQRGRASSPRSASTRRSSSATA